ncbi:MAG: hypothetical protein LBU79_06300, partial [Planctomycetota bacterium]|nr:hypothetical protein [Planctomycetota bacterium]
MVIRVTMPGAVAERLFPLCANISKISASQNKDKIPVKEGNREVSRSPEFCSLDMILATLTRQLIIKYGNSFELSNCAGCCNLSSFRVKNFINQMYV